jgi:hypothetical protein
VHMLDLHCEHQKKDKAAKDATAMKKKDRRDAVECHAESLAIFVESMKELEHLQRGPTKVSIDIVVLMS